MPWIIDTDIFIEGERGNSAFLPWLQGADGIATADVVRGEFLMGTHAPSFVKEAFSFTPTELRACPHFLPNRRITPKPQRWQETHGATVKANLD